jgi:hypothetical protein
VDKEVDLILDVINTNDKYLKMLSKEYHYYKIHEILTAEQYIRPTGNYIIFTVFADCPIHNQYNRKITIEAPYENYRKYIDYILKKNYIPKSS